MRNVPKAFGINAPLLHVLNIISSKAKPILIINKIEIDLIGLEYIGGTGPLQMRELHNFIPVEDFTKRAMREMDH